MPLPSSIRPCWRRYPVQATLTRSKVGIRKDCEDENLPRESIGEVKIMSILLLKSSQEQAYSNNLINVDEPLWVTNPLQSENH